MQPLRIFVDANVLFSACIPGSPVGSIFRETLDRHELFTCAIALEETRRNLGAKNPAWLPPMQMLEPRLGIVPEAPAPAEVTLPQIDGILLGAAVAADCDIFITGDHRHFGKLFGRTIAGVRILTPAMFAKEYAH
jgi:predicted nucleic acid-binding protein